MIMCDWPEVDRATANPVGSGDFVLASADPMEKDRKVHWPVPTVRR